MNDKRDLWMTKDTYEWQKRPMNETKETYEWQKRPMNETLHTTTYTKETYEWDKRDLWMRQKRPMNETFSLELPRRRISVWNSCARSYGYRLCRLFFSFLKKFTSRNRRLLMWSSNRNCKNISEVSFTVIFFDEFGCELRFENFKRLLKWLLTRIWQPYICIYIYI